MLEFLKKLLKAKEEARAALAAKAEKSEDVAELRGINSQMEALNAEILDLRAQIETAEAEQRAQGGNEGQAARTQAVNSTEANGIEARAFSPATNFNPVAGANLEKRTQDTVDYEKRGKDLIEKRSVTVAASSIILPQHQATDIKGTFNQVSTLIDRVTIKPLLGGESYKRSYVKGYGKGDYTEEGGTPATTEPTFGYADINKSKITAYAEDTEEVEKLPAAAYAQEVEKGVRIALRKKGTAEILIGDGSTNHLMGIFNSAVIETSSDITVSDIDNTTLDEIIFSYGGDEEVEDAAVLILNKKDLKAFSQLRTADGKKVHTIVSNGNTGTIDGVPYIINSNCKAISDEATLTGAYCMAYGPLSNYELAVFSDVDIKKSTDYKFKEGMVAHRGVTFIGGNVAAHNGFLRVKK
jgi:HK97 family phage major capsid protein